MRLAFFLSCGVVCAAGAAWAAGDERAAIIEERRALTARFDAQEQACRERFAVTPCIQGVRALRRAALAPLREREMKLDAAERMQRSAERQAAVQAKQRAAATPPQGTPVPERSLRKPPRPAAAASSVEPAARRGATESARAAEAAAKVQVAKRRQAEIQARQARVARRQTERAAAGKSAAPLPGPGASGSGR
ncbi:MAG: hypothetical protein Q8K96_12570 [Rubrivivax sp.]|nr:hypothetical protein [Rubrivivax sp.]